MTGLIAAIFAAIMAFGAGTASQEAKLYDIKARVEQVQTEFAGVEKERDALKNGVFALKVQLANERDKNNAFAGENELLWQALEAETTERHALESELKNLQAWQKEARVELQARDLELQAKHETILAQQDRIAGQELLVARGLESAKKVNKLRVENRTLDGLYSLTRAERDGALLREKAANASADEYADSSFRNFVLYQSKSAEFERFRTYAFGAGLAALILLAGLGYALWRSLRKVHVTEEFRDRWQKGYVKVLVREQERKEEYEKRLDEAKKAKDDTLEALSISISERDALRNRVAETEVDGLELVVKRPEKDLWLRDKDNPGTEYPVAGLVCPGGEGHPKHTGPGEFKLKNARSKHYKVEHSVEL